MNTKNIVSWIEFIRYRSNMCTYFEWLLQRGRIPNENAIWEKGNYLNYQYQKFSINSFKDNCCYCHFEDTRKPSSKKELEEYLYKYFFKIYL